MPAAERAVVVATDAKHLARAFALAVSTRPRFCTLSCQELAARLAAILERDFPEDDILVGADEAIFVESLVDQD